MDKYIIYDEETQTYSMDPEQAVRDDVEKHHWLNTIKTIIKDWRLYLMLVPMLFVFFCWRYLPMYELLGAFKYSNSSLDVADQQYVGFYYFARLINGDVSPDFWAAFRNTFLLSFYGMCFGFPMPIIVALFFNEIKSNILRSTFQVMTYLPKFMSTVVMTTLTIMLLKQSDLVSEMGVVSNFMVKLGLISEDVGASGLLNGPQYFRAIYQITGIWEGAGYDSIVYFAAIIAISPTSYEAAQIDGAGKMAQMRYVVLPCILSTVVIMLINRIGSLLSIGYEKVLLLTENSTSYTVYQTAEVVSTWAYKQGMATSGEGGEPGLASAAEMMNNLTGMILVIGANTIARKATDVSLY
ncbi:MAG: sugar ABC transporter permease [Clostridia bacterium]|nr:sugar ABC transporter permease [Clostridia bacterium]MBQ9707102.1 sugar ABC transporter permease [Clostridia bacterium]